MNDEDNKERFPYRVWANGSELCGTADKDFASQTVRGLMEKPEQYKNVHIRFRRETILDWGKQEEEPLEKFVVLAAVLFTWDEIVEAKNEDEAFEKVNSKLHAMSLDELVTEVDRIRRTASHSLASSIRMNYDEVEPYEE